MSPLFKYLISGPDAVTLIDRVITRDAAALEVGQVYYTPWCDDHGKVIDDGTVMRLGHELYRWTAADPSLRWFTENADRLTVSIDDVSEQTAALALQGPMSAAMLGAVLPGRHPAPEVFPRDEDRRSAGFRSRCREPATRAISATRSGSRGTGRLRSGTG